MQLQVPSRVVKVLPCTLDPCVTYGAVVMQPSPADVHWFAMHGITLLILGLLALYSAAFITDRVHKYWYVHDPGG